MRLIDLDDSAHTYHGGMEMWSIDTEKTVDAEPVRHGAWLPCDKNGYVLTETELRDGSRWYGYKCSECNNIYHGNALTKYCPNCGAKMDDERRMNCLECEEYNHEKHYCPKYCEVIRGTLKEAIPISYIEETIAWAKDNGSAEYADYLTHLLSVWAERAE